MPRGAPDYSNVRVDQSRHRLYDQGELAARLGSPIVYDKAGILIWCTSFEHGLQGATFGVDHPDSKGSLTSARAYYGSFSCMFDPRGVDGAYVNWGRVIHFLESGPIGGEINLSLDASPDAVRLELFHRDGERALIGLVHYQTDGGVWKIATASGSWVTVLEDFELQPGASAWHPIKLVVDTKKKRYVRLLASKQNVPLSKYDLFDTPSEALGQLEIRVTVYGSPTRHAAAYADGVIVTQQEP